MGGKLAVLIKVLSWSILVAYRYIREVWNSVWPLVIETENIHSPAGAFGKQLRTHLGSVEMARQQIFTEKLNFYYFTTDHKWALMILLKGHRLYLLLNSPLKLYKTACRVILLGSVWALPFLTLLSPSCPALFQCIQSVLLMWLIASNCCCFLFTDPCVATVCSCFFLCCVYLSVCFLPLLPSGPAMRGTQLWRLTAPWTTWPRPWTWSSARGGTERKTMDAGKTLHLTEIQDGAPVVLS